MTYKKFDLASWDPATLDRGLGAWITVTDKIIPPWWGPVTHHVEVASIHKKESRAKARAKANGGQALFYGDTFKRTRRPRVGDCVCIFWEGNSCYFLWPSI